MGYCYLSNGKLSCDACDGDAPARKRHCRYRVIYGDGSLPYCQAPALCAACYAKHKATLHGEDCRRGAEASQAEENARVSLLASGAALLAGAWGDWHSMVPAGNVGCRFVDARGVEFYFLIPTPEHDAGREANMHTRPESFPSRVACAPFVGM